MTDSIDVEQAEQRIQQRFEQAMRPALPPAKPRLREYVWAIAALCLAVAHLQSTDVSENVIAERKDDCKVAKQRASEHATALVHLLNQKTVELQGAIVSCRVRHSEEKS
jgi:hypothetical protein